MWENVQRERESRPPDGRHGPPAPSVEDQVNALIRRLQPTPLSEQRRSAVFRYIQDVVKSQLPWCTVVSVGSFPLKTYLPCADVDIAIFLPRSDDLAGGDAAVLEDWGQQFELRNTLGEDAEDAADDDESARSNTPTPALVAINNALCMVAAKRGGKRGLDAQPRPAPASEIKREPEIRSVSYVNARTPMVTMLVGNVVVDVTENQGGSVAALVLMEEADRLIQQNHLFKRSLLLLKAWALCETPRLVGQRVLGAREGGLTSYGLSIMVLHLFSSRSSADTLLQPLDVLIRFFQVFTEFDWSRNCLTLDGPVAFDERDRVCRPQSKGTRSSRLWRLVDNVLKHISPDTTEKTGRVRKLRGSRSGRRPDGHDATSGPSASVPGACSSPVAHFPKRHCNIQDPLNPLNNLGHSVNGQSLKALKDALRQGRRQLEGLQLWPPDMSRFPSSRSVDARQRLYQVEPAGAGRTQAGYQLEPAGAGRTQAGSNGWVSCDLQGSGVEQDPRPRAAGANVPLQSTAPMAASMNGSPGPVPYFPFLHVPPVHPGVVLGSAPGQQPVTFGVQQYHLGHPQSLVQLAPPLYQFVFHPCAIPEGRVVVASTPLPGGQGQTHPGGVVFLPSSGIQGPAPVGQAGMHRSASEPVFPTEQQSIARVGTAGHGHGEPSDGIGPSRPCSAPWAGAEPTWRSSGSLRKVGVDERSAIGKGNFGTRRTTRLAEEQQRHHTSSPSTLPWSLPAYASSSAASSTASMSESAEDGSKDEHECQSVYESSADDELRQGSLGTAQKPGPSWPSREPLLPPFESSNNGREQRGGVKRGRGWLGAGSSVVDVPSSGVVANWFLRDFFPHCCQLYGAGDDFREDLLDHPCQHWSSNVRPAVSALPLGTRDILSGASTEMWGALKCVGQISSAVPRQPTWQPSGVKGKAGQPKSDRPAAREASGGLRGTKEKSQPPDADCRGDDQTVEIGLAHTLAYVSAPSKGTEDRDASTTTVGRSMSDRENGLGLARMSTSGDKEGSKVQQGVVAPAASGPTIEACADDESGSTTSEEQGERRNPRCSHVSVESTVRPPAPLSPATPCLPCTTVDAGTSPPPATDLHHVAVSTQTDDRLSVSIVGVGQAVPSVSPGRATSISCGTQCGMAIAELNATSTQFDFATSTQFDFKPLKATVASLGIQCLTGATERTSIGTQCGSTVVDDERKEALARAIFLESTENADAGTAKDKEAQDDEVDGSLAVITPVPRESVLEQECLPATAIPLEPGASADASAPTVAMWKSKHRRRKKKTAARTSILPQVSDNDETPTNPGAASGVGSNEICASETPVQHIEARANGELSTREAHGKFAASWAKHAPGGSPRRASTRVMFFWCALSLMLAVMWRRTGLERAMNIDRHIIPPAPSSANESEERRAQPPMWVVVGGSLTLGDVWTPRAGEGEEFEWFKDGKRLPGRTRSFLTISTAGLEDEGTYSCFSYSGTGKAKRSLLWDEATVRISEPPSVESQLQTQRLARGEMLAIVATASGVPQPQYQWRRNGVPIPGANRPMLVRHSVTKADMGTYTCDVFNVAGSVQWEEMAVILREDSDERQTRSGRRHSV